MCGGQVGAADDVTRRHLASTWKSLFEDCDERAGTVRIAAPSAKSWGRSVRAGLKVGTAVHDAYEREN